MKDNIKECLEAVDKILLDAGADTKEKQLWKLWELHIDCIDKKKYTSSMRAVINHRWKDLHEIFADVERYIQKHNVRAVCFKCGNNHQVGMGDFYESHHCSGKDYKDFKYMCSQCRPSVKC